MRQGDFDWVGRDRREGVAAAGCGGESGSRLPQSRIGVWLLALCSLLFAHSAHAQWQSTTYELKGGWNSIYLHGEATHDTPDGLFASGDAANIEEVWRWNPNPTQVQFTTDPLIPTPGTPEWSTWYRGNPGASTLSAMTGQTAYLVKCSRTTANSYSVPIKHRPQPPSSVWVRNGANLLGFPTFKNGSVYPTMSNYFATFPAAIAANTKIFKYVGGDLGPGNPLQIFSPTFEQVDRNQAYWFDAEVVGSFYAPIEISPTVSSGLEFGRTRSIIAVRLRNRTSAAVTITVTPETSAAAPASQTGVVGPVPLTRRTFDTGSNQYVETAISGAFNEVIGPQSSMEIEFGIDRGSLSANSNDFYASFLKFTDSGNLMEVFVPASAQPSTLAGLWIGDVEVTDVSRAVLEDARAEAVIENGSVAQLNLIGSGGREYESTPSVTIEAPSPGVIAEATAELTADSVSAIVVDIGGTKYTSPPLVTVQAPGSGTTATATATVANGAVTGITVNDPGSGYVTPPLVTIEAPPPGITATATATLTDDVVSDLSITNPGSGYGSAPKVTIDLPPPPAGSETLRPFQLRYLLHVDDGGVARLLSQVYTGILDAPPNNLGVCTVEEALKMDSKASAARFVAGHLPLDLVLTPASGSVALGATAQWSLPLPFNDNTSPFVHQYHPDHDNKDPRGADLGNGIESFTVNRTISLSFLASPPSGTPGTGWGTTVLGGNYTEVVTGLQKNPITSGGTFTFRRVNDIGGITLAP